MHEVCARVAAEFPPQMSIGGDPAPRARYTSVAFIAKGGMGYVELCCRREGRFLRWAARKRVHEQLRGDPHFRSMFMDEGRLAGLVRHPNIVSVSEVGEDADGPFLIMDYVDGVSLSRFARQAKRAGRDIPLQVAVRICKDAATGLHAAHEVRAEDGSVMQLVHRDVSPQNILIGFDGSVRVTDFGIAKALGNASHTTAGVLKGNMGYLSPEQLRFQKPDRRSDVFSLGVTLFELVSGKRLYSNRSGFDGTRRILDEPPPDIRAVRAAVPESLVGLLFQMLAKEPAGRPATACEVAARLEGILMSLIAAEGPLTVADYMDRHFSTARDRHHELLAQHFSRVDRGIDRPSAWLAVSPEYAKTKLDCRPLLRRRRRRRGWFAAAFSAIVVLAAVQCISQFARHSASRAVPMTTALAVPATVEIVRLPSPVAEAVVDAPTSPRASLPPAAASWRENRPRHDQPRRSRARQRLVAPVQIDPAQPGHIAVPLYTRWR
jgi:hypothetical protein